MDSTLLGGWSNHIIGQSYIDIYNHKTRSTLSTTYKSVSHNKRHKTMLKQIGNFMGKGICTANFYTPLHFDIRDGNNITNCAYSVPPKWTKNNKTDTVFSLGNYIIDISSSNCNIAFLGNHSLHSTGIPSNCKQSLKYMPEVLKKDLSLERALKDKNLIKSYLSQAIIGWGHFGNASAYNKYT